MSTATTKKPKKPKTEPEANGQPIDDGSVSEEEALVIMTGDDSDSSGWRALEADRIQAHEDDQTVPETNEAPTEAEIQEEVIYGSGDAELRASIDIKMLELFVEQHQGRRLEQAEADAADTHKKAKKARETQDEAIKDCIDELEALFLNEPQPNKYPLFDRPNLGSDETPEANGDTGHAEVNAMFPAATEDAQIDTAFAEADASLEATKTKKPRKKSIPDA